MFHPVKKCRKLKIFRWEWNKSEGSTNSTIPESCINTTHISTMEKGLIVFLYEFKQEERKGIFRHFGSVSILLSVSINS